MQNEPGSVKKYLLRAADSRLEYPIPFGTTIIGRAPTCDLTLTEGATSVSRTHAEIRKSANQLLITDLRSRNHTFVNGRDIFGLGPVAIDTGDRISICQFELVVIEDGKPLPGSGSCKVTDDENECTLDTSSSLRPSSASSLIPAQNQRLAALISISRSLSGVLNTDELLATAIDTLLAVFTSANRCVIGYINEDGSFRAQWWKIRRPDSASVIEVSQRIVRQVLETAEVLLFEDAAGVLDDADSVLDMNLRSIMCAPLVDAEGRVFGMIQVDSEIIDRFNNFDLDVFAAAAVQIGLALNFSRLHQALVEDVLMRNDLEQARAVQKQFLPSAAPEVAAYEFADYYSPARQLGGDYFDYIELNREKIAIVLGDVVGKGAPAALNMVKLAAETRATFEITESPSEVMCRLNRRLSGSFVTCVIIILDAEQHSLTITNAGHELPLLKAHDGEVIDIGYDVTDLPLSVREHVQYEEKTIGLSVGETVAVFSDGFVDAENVASGKRYGRLRMQQIMSRHDGNPRQFADTLVSNIQKFVNGSPQFDDMCLVCLQRIG